MHYFKQSNILSFFYYSIVTIQQKLIMAYYKIFILWIRLITGAWIWTNKLNFRLIFMALEHLSQAPQFLGPFPSQSSIAWPFIITLRSRQLVVEQQLLLEQAPLSAMDPTWLCKCYNYEVNCCEIAIPTKRIIKWPHPQLVLLLKGLYLLTEPCKKSDFFSWAPLSHTLSIEGIKKLFFFHCSYPLRTMNRRLPFKFVIKSLHISSILTCPSSVSWLYIIFHMKTNIYK